MKQKPRTIVDGNEFRNVISKIPAILSRPQRVNWLRLNIAYTHHLNGSPLVQILACRLSGTELLPTSNLTYDILWNTVKFESKYICFPEKNRPENRLQKSASSFKFCFVTRGYWKPDDYAYTYSYKYSNYKVAGCPLHFARFIYRLPQYWPNYQPGPVVFLIESVKGIQSQLREDRGFYWHEITFCEYSIRKSKDYV